MAKIVKSVRIDEELLDIIERYKKEMRRLFGVNVSVGAILSQSVVIGFEENLKIIKLLTEGHLTYKNGVDTPVVTEDTIKICEDYEQLSLSYLLNE